MKYQRAWAEINLSNLSDNIEILKKRLPPGVRLMGVVKADAYGHGIVPVARTVSQKTDALGVAIFEEGAAIRADGITLPVLIMGFTPEPLLPDVVRLDLTQTVFSKAGAEALSREAARQKKRAAIHIKIDTGMSRLGFLPDRQSVEAVCEIAANPNLDVAGIYTHCATSDALENSFMFEQRERFNRFLCELTKRGVQVPQKHFANSGVFAQSLRALDISETELFLDIVRLGILMYGYPPSAEMAETCKILALKPVMRLMTQVSSVKELPAGVGISYGHIYKTTRPSTIAVLPVGYADGYPRRLSNGGRVLINGRFAPIAGAICMDQCMIDITGIPGVEAGTPVTMLGTAEEGICADSLAEIVGTISYEVLCGIGKRVKRIEVGSQKSEVRG